MKTPLQLGVLTFLLLAATGRCWGMMSIEEVTKARAKELGLEIRSNGAGPDAVRVELEFKTEGELKGYSRVDLEIMDGGKLGLFASLKEEPAQPGHVLVSFAADRERLEKAMLRIVLGTGLERVGLDLHMKDFVDPGKPAAPPPPASATPAKPPVVPPAAPAAPGAGVDAPATPPPPAPPGAPRVKAEEETRLLTAVRKAFVAADPAALSALTCWDNVPEKRKDDAQRGYAALVAETDVMVEPKLVEPERGFIDKPQTEDGVTYRANLPIIRQLNMVFRDVRDNRILFILSNAVGEKDGKLYLTAAAPMK